MIIGIFAERNILNEVCQLFAIRTIVRIYVVIRIETPKHHATREVMEAPEQRWLPKIEASLPGPGCRPRADQDQRKKEYSVVGPAPPRPHQNEGQNRRTHKREGENCFVPDHKPAEASEDGCQYVGWPLREVVF